jgi:hypothetical protein
MTFFNILGEPNSNGSTSGLALMNKAKLEKHARDQAGVGGLASGSAGSWDRLDGMGNERVGNRAARGRAIALPSGGAGDALAAAPYAAVNIGTGGDLVTIGDAAPIPGGAKPQFRPWRKNRRARG